MALLPPNPESYDEDTIAVLITNIIDVASVLIGGIAVIYLLIGAYWYITAFGNEEKANKGKTTITWAVAGIVVILLARVIIAEIWKFLTNKPANF